MNTTNRQEENYVMTYVSAHAYFTNNNGECLVIQRSPTNRYMPLYWDIPGGKLLDYEDAESAILREVKEETDLDIKSVGAPLSVYVNRHQLPNRKDVQIVFKCEINNADKPIILSSREHCQYRWIKPSELHTLDCMAYLKAFFKLIIGEQA